MIEQQLFGLTRPLESVFYSIHLMKIWGCLLGNARDPNLLAMRQYYSAVRSLQIVLGTVNHIIDPENFSNEGMDLTVEW
jgi:hypothetical protein